MESLINSECRYLVIDDNSRGDSWVDVYDTLDNANRAAARDWQHLTASERSTRHIYVLQVLPDCLADDAFDEETGAVIDWTFWHSGHSSDGFFDSSAAPRSC